MRTSIGLTAFLTLGLLGAAGTCTPVRAQAAPDGWEVTVEPYVMGAVIDGTTGIADRVATVDLSASDILPNLQFGAMAIVVARKGNWGLGGDLIWASLGTTVERPPANIDVDQGAVAFYALRRLGPAAEALLGMRWNHLKTSIGVLGTSAGRTKDWVDPIVGLNLHTPARGRVHAGLYSEIGGFGAGSSLAWQIFPTVGVNVGGHAGVDAGYRWMQTEYESGEDRARFKYDIRMQGPVVGFTFRF